MEKGFVNTSQLHGSVTERIFFSIIFCIFFMKCSNKGLWHGRSRRAVQKIATAAQVYTVSFCYLPLHLLISEK
jgi:hypothetical protein